MKVVQYKAYGNSDVIELADVPTPEIRSENQVLIQVKAASVNPLDIKIRNGIMQKIRPVSLPFIPGADVAGIVMATGSKVKHFKAGDEVIAVCRAGGYAGYTLVNESDVALKPLNIMFEEAASLVVNIGTAQSVLFDEAKLTKGQRVLIQGAAGATGATMVQMAKNAGAYVIATASGPGVALVRSLGADEVVDYKSQDVAQLVKDIDLVVDCAGGESQHKLFEVLKPGGKLFSIVIPPSADLAEKYQVEARFISSGISARSLSDGLDLVKKGKLRPIVAKTFRLEEAAQAQDLLSAGGVNGKIVLVVV
ncbi:NADP-dependent oxidoreductase [Mucilaginibacter phyllosphaerae]|uniref:NADP-dependent oxidoreductase n=1 Tax=Mucilaginibacter phyllosphaerae TaxID=1812349 RepID=A0A4Y8ABM2_9SPHI|nr:NADP-dependent oxidoreductase [Mucilaginibacter phyllosphaerae]MBB3969228.1 NADPH:quinone reductase-like Zn-dependent oxidoreductase [Mucilaginibacter phyllosphaerae]TEW65971.1 NADP-dependent oxidoreductase [Mucilaginibacter phyllosphaerae]